MKLSSRGVMCLVVSLGVLSGCAQRTEVIFEVKTDLPCDTVAGVIITVGLAGETEDSDPVDVSRKCSSDGSKLNFIGTYTMKPKTAGTTPEGAIRFALAVGDAVDPESDCTPAKQFKGCIVARRRFTFINQRRLVVPIDLMLVCKDVRCDAESTCNRAGKCVSSVVNTEACDIDGNCNDLVSTPGEGVACVGANNASVNCGPTGWCTVGSNGIGVCVGAPLSSGLSYQCRDSKDCGANLTCVSGTANIVGQCATTVAPGARVVCRPGAEGTPCAMGACIVDAGVGLLACSVGGAVDGGTSDGGADGGLLDGGSNVDAGIP